VNTLAAWGAVLGAAIAVPHAVPLDRVRPIGAAAVWGVALVARTIVVIGLVLTAVVCLPDTPRFAARLRELPHHVIAGVGDTELVVGGLTLLAAVAVGRRLRGCRQEARALIRPLAVRGPGGSVVVGDRDVLPAAVGWRRPAIVVSAGALAALDDAELAAGLAQPAWPRVPVPR
jgi:Zn-dependent protease with chaperone function